MIWSKREGGVFLSCYEWKIRSIHFGRRHGAPAIQCKQTTVLSMITVVHEYTSRSEVVFYEF